MVQIDAAQLARSLHRLEPVSAGDITTALQQVITACVELFRVTGSGLMIADEDNILRAAVASDGPSRALEEVQARTGQGPCVDSFVNRQVVTADDLGADNRWPESREALIRNGVRAVLGVPVVLGGVTIGSLDLYMDRPHRWDDSECDALVRYSRILEATLDAALRARHSGELADQLQFALDNRVVIDRAVGFLMAAHRVDAVTAFNILRRTARNQRRKAVEVARHLLDTGALPDLSDPRR
jgi:GAF domain-containing protein